MENKCKNIPNLKKNHPIKENVISRRKFTSTLFAEFI